MAKTVILDTNFLMVPFQFRVDILSEIARICDFSHKVAVLDRSVEELGKIMREQKGRHRAAAGFALQFLKKKGLKIIRTHSQKSADDLLAEHAEKGAIIATQDAELKRRVRQKGGRIIFLRGKKFLKLE